MKALAIITAITSLAFTSVAVQAKGEEPTELNHTVSEVKLGSHVAGTEVKPESLPGKVVVVVKWGIR